MQYSEINTFHTYLWNEKPWFIFPVVYSNYTPYTQTSEMLYWIKIRGNKSTGKTYILLIDN